MKGKTYVLGDDVNTDLIMPAGAYSRSGRYSGDLEAAARHIFEPIRPDIAEKVEEGDIIVAGENFGSGSGRESAPATIKASGIQAVVAESFARIFYRNSINIGLPVVTCHEARQLIDEGHTVKIDLENAKIWNITTGEEGSIELYSPEVEAIFEAGGLKGYYISKLYVED
jgi:3-isopropylmalate/(R)-2-methylmalate dehydratase small subunit